MPTTYYMYLANPFNSGKYCNRNFPDRNCLPNELQDRIINTRIVRESKVVWCYDEDKIYFDEYFEIGKIDNPHARRSKQILVGKNDLSRYPYYNGQLLDDVNDVTASVEYVNGSNRTCLSDELSIKRMKGKNDLVRLNPFPGRYPYYPSFLIEKAFYEFNANKKNIRLPKICWECKYKEKTYCHVKISEKDLIYASANVLNAVIDESGYINIGGPSYVQYDVSVEDQMKNISGASSILGLAGITINGKKYRFGFITSMMSVAFIQNYVEYGGRGLSTYSCVQKGYVPMYGGPNEDCFGFDLRNLSDEQLNFDKKSRLIIK